MDWLEIIFQFDQGEGHLEYFAKTVEFQDHSFPQTPMDILGIVALPTISCTNYDTEHLQSHPPPPLLLEFCCPTPRKRGPPSIS